MSWYGFMAIVLVVLLIELGFRTRSRDCFDRYYRDARVDYWLHGHKYTTYERLER